jgi:hypothetical protein
MTEKQLLETYEFKSGLKPSRSASSRTSYTRRLLIDTWNEFIKYAEDFDQHVNEIKFKDGFCKLSPLDQMKLFSMWLNVEIELQEEL